MKTIIVTLIAASLNAGGWFVVDLRGYRRAGPFIDQAECGAVARSMNERDETVRPSCRYFQ